MRSPFSVVKRILQRYRSKSSSCYWTKTLRIKKWATVDSLLTNTSIRRTPLYDGHLELVPASLYSFYLTLYKTDTSLRRTLSAGPKGVRLRES